MFDLFETGTFDLLETEENVTAVSRTIQYSLAAILDSSPAMFFWVTWMEKTMKMKFPGNNPIRCCLMESAVIKIQFDSFGE